MNRYRFVRFGGLSGVPQKGYGSDNFHAPPARSGIYAMPFDMVEMSLVPIVNDRSKKSSREVPHVSTKYIKQNGKKITTPYNSTKTELAKDIAKKLYKDDYVYNSNVYTYTKNGVNYYLEHEKPKTFIYSGDIWCHLQVYVPIKERDVLKRHGSWILLDFNDWFKYYKYAKARTKSRNYNNRSYEYQDQEYFEVFLEKVK